MDGMMGGFIRGLEKLVDKFYTNFLLRDMVYITSGLLIIFFFLLSTNLVQPYIASPKYFKVFTIACSYYIGLLNQELMVSIGIFRMFPKIKAKKFSKQETETILKIIQIIDSSPEKAISDSFKRVERIFTIKNIMTAFGSSLLLCLFILLCHIMLLVLTPKSIVSGFSSMTVQSYFMSVIILVALIIGAISSNRRKVIVQESLLHELTEARQENILTAPAMSEDNMNSLSSLGEDIIEMGR